MIATTGTLKIKNHILYLIVNNINTAKDCREQRIVSQNSDCKKSCPPSFILNSSHKRMQTLPIKNV